MGCKRAILSSPRIRNVLSLTAMGSRQKAEVKLLGEVNFYRIVADIASDSQVGPEGYAQDAPIGVYFSLRTFNSVDLRLCLLRESLRNNPFNSKHGAYSKI